MEDSSWKCAVCLVGKAVFMWRPFETLAIFETDVGSNSKEESIQCCKDCKSRVYQMLRGDGASFDGCESIQEVKYRIRKEFQL